MCQVCGKDTPCDGDLEPNPDGWPESTCGLFHLPAGGINPRFVCEDCANCRHDWRMSGAGVKECRTCGAEAHNDAA
jgi:hypothetical protein